MLNVFILVSERKNEFLFSISCIVGVNVFL